MTSHIFFLGKYEPQLGNSDKQIIIMTAHQFFFFFPILYESDLLCPKNSCASVVRGFLAVELFLYAGLPNIKKDEFLTSYTNQFYLRIQGTTCTKYYDFFYVCLFIFATRCSRILLDNTLVQAPHTSLWNPYQFAMRKSLKAPRDGVQCYGNTQCFFLFHSDYG